MKLNRWLSGVLATALLALTSSASYGFDTYTITDISLGTDGVCRALGINASGVVTATFGIDGLTNSTYLWSNGIGVSLPLPGDSGASYGINSLNTACGYWTDSSSGISGAFLSQGLSISSLPPFSGGTLAWAYGINDGGTVVGGSGSNPNRSDIIATIWQGGEAAMVPGVSVPSMAWAINNSNVIVGLTKTDGSASMQPFSVVGNALSLLPMIDSRFEGGAAYNVNSHGHIVGVCYLNGQACGTLWRDGVATDLGDLFNRSFNQGDVIATGINSYDQVVGTNQRKANDFTDSVAFIWEDGQIVDLNTLVVGGSNYNITEARSINDSGQITCSAYQRGHSHALLLTPIVTLTDFTVNPGSVLADSTATGTVTINRRAPLAGTTVTLASSDTSVATVPPTVTVPFGQTTVNFPITTHAVSVDKNVALRATYGGQVLTFILQVLTRNPHLNGFVLTPHAAFDGQSVSGVVTLRLPAPSGGVRITLTNTDQSVASVPTTITIPQGASSKSFTSTAHAPLNPVSTTATATLGDVHIPQIVTVQPIALQGLDLAQDEVTGGGTVHAVVRIPVAAPSGGYRISLSSSDHTLATVPTTVTIPHGAQAVSFSVVTKAVGGTAFVTITATHGSSTVSKQLQVLPPEVSSFRLSPTQTKGGHNVSGTVVLTGKAPVGGVTIHLGAYPSLAWTTSDVIVRAGSTSVSFTLHTAVVTQNTSVSLTASAFSVAKTVALTLTP